MASRLLTFCAHLLLLLLPIAAANPAPAESGPAEAARGVVVDTDDRPVAGAAVKKIGFDKTSKKSRTSKVVKTNERGSFEIPVAKGDVQGNWLYALCYAETDDGRIGYVEAARPKPDGLKIVLKPAREVTTIVRDSQGHPAAGAWVEFFVGFRVLARGETDGTGRFAFRAPLDVSNWTITAHRSQLGFDFLKSGQTEQTVGTTSLRGQVDLPDQIDLVLDGARTVRFRAVDHTGKPVAGVQIGPWLIQKPNRSGQMNLSGTQSSWTTTDEQGRAALDWLPHDFGDYLSFIHTVEGYYATSHSVSLRADKPQDELTIELLPLEKLSGRVTVADGKPAAGAQVTLVGQGANQNAFRRGTRTDDDGRYELEVYSEQAYLVQASHESLISPPRTDVVVRIGKPVAGVDLVLGPATKLRGKVTVGPNRRPVANTSIRAYSEKGEITQDLPRKAGERSYYALYLDSYVQTDAQGEYEMLLGPSEYKVIGPPRSEPVTVTVPDEDPPAEIVQDFHMEREELGPLAGTVVDAAGKPVAGASVKGRYASDHARRLFPETKCDEQGRFQVERSLEPLVLYAQSTDGKLAGIVRSDAEATETRVVVQPAATASGTMKDPDGKILAGKSLRYGIRIYLGEAGRSAFSDSFGGEVRTDADGKFTLPRLVPDQEYTLSIKLDEHSSRNVTTLTAKSDQPLALGELSVDPNPTPPYREPTPAERAAKAFAAKPEVSAADRVQAILSDAKVEYFRPLVIFATADDPACIELFRLFYESASEGGQKGQKDAFVAPNELRWEFDFVSLDLNRPGVREYAKELGVDLSAGKPLVVLLTDQGQVSDTLALELNEGKLDPRELSAWMSKHKLPTRNAVDSLQAALAKAKAENKRVFFTFSATWCGPCRMLSRALTPFKSELEKHMVFVKVDVSRDEQVDELRDRFSESKRAGVPWFCIIDPQDEAKVLIDSNMAGAKSPTENTNIGFPTQPKEVDHFLSVLQQGAPNLGEETLEKCKNALLKK